MHRTETIATSWAGLSELRPLVVGYLRRYLRDDAEIEDTAQETLLRAARFRVHLTDPGRLRAWTLRIALNVLRDRRRRERRLPRAEADEDFLLGIEGREEVPGESADGPCFVLSGVPVERCTAIELLDAAFATLDPADRGLLTGERTPETAHGRAGAVSEGSRPAVSKHRVYRARRRLSRALLLRLAQEADLGGSPSGAAAFEPRSVEGAPCARTRSGSWSVHGARLRP